TQAETEAAGDEPRLRTRAHLAVRRNDEFLGARAPVVALDARVTYRVEVEPHLRVVLLTVGEGKICIARMQREESEHVAIRRFLHLRLAVIFRGSGIVDVACEELPLA